MEPFFFATQSANRRGSFGLVGFLSNLARLTFIFRNIINSCPQSVKDSAVYQVGEEASLPIKVAEIPSWTRFFFVDILLFLDSSKTCDLLIHFP